ncbi:hypothetical protein Hanom_Chr03g00217361 [Helianthus anomalus]
MSRGGGSVCGLSATGRSEEGVFVGESHRRKTSTAAVCGGAIVVAGVRPVPSERERERCRCVCVSDCSA